MGINCFCNSDDDIRIPDANYYDILVQSSPQKSDTPHFLLIEHYHLRIPHQKSYDGKTNTKKKTTTVQKVSPHNLI